MVKWSISLRVPDNHGGKKAVHRIEVRASAKVPLRVEQGREIRELAGQRVAAYEPDRLLFRENLLNHPLVLLGLERTGHVDQPAAGREDFESVLKHSRLQR